MEDEANSVINPLVVTEGMVTTFMSNDPDTGEIAALECPVDGPSNIGEGMRKEVEIRGGNVVQEKGYAEVVNDIGE